MRRFSGKKAKGPNKRRKPGPKNNTKNTQNTGNTGKTPGTRSYSAEQILAATNPTSPKGATERTGDTPRNGGPEPASSATGSAKDRRRERSSRFEGLRFLGDGRIGRKGDPENKDLAELFDADGGLWSAIIFWTVTALAIAGGLVVLLFLLLVARELWPGGGSGGDAPVEQAARSSVRTQEERAAAAVAEGFVRNYLTSSAADDSSDAEQRLDPFVSGSELDGLIAMSSGEEAERVVVSASPYRVQQVSQGQGGAGRRYAVFVDALTISDRDPNLSEVEGAGGAGSAADSADSNESGSSGGEEAQGDSNSTGSSGSASTASTADTGEPEPGGAQTGAVRRMALKVYVGGSGGRYGVVAPPTAVSAPEPAAGLEPGAITGEGSYGLTDEALEDLLRGYFSAAYGNPDARASVREFFAQGATLPTMPAAGYTYLDLEGATLYELPDERVGEHYAEAYRVEAYVSVREEASGSTANQTHLLRVGKRDGGQGGDGQWTITGAIGG